MTGTPAWQDLRIVPSGRNKAPCHECQTGGSKPDSHLAIDSQMKTPVSADGIVPAERPMIPNHSLTGYL